MRTMDAFNLAEILVELIGAHVELKNFEKAQTFLDEAQGIQIDSRYVEVFVTYGEGVLAQAKRNLELAASTFRRCLKLANQMELSEYIIRALFQLATLELFEYRISEERENLCRMRELLEEAHRKARASGMDLYTLEIGILNGVACVANMEYDCALAHYEESEAEAKKLGFSGKVAEIQDLID